jgi:hypothetical protein
MLGIASYRGEANGLDGRLKRRSVSRLAFRFRLRASRTLGPSNVSLARRPKVGARCGKSARRALSGGRLERAVPTGTGSPGKATTRGDPTPGFWVSAPGARRGGRSGAAVATPSSFSSWASAFVRFARAGAWTEAGVARREHVALSLEPSHGPHNDAHDERLKRLARLRWACHEREGVTASDVHAVEHHDVEAGLQVQARAKAVDEGDGARLRCRESSALGLGPVVQRGRTRAHTCAAPRANLPLSTMTAKRGSEYPAVWLSQSAIPSSQDRLPGTTTWPSGNVRV